jgi:hypothetical protein
MNTKTTPQVVDSSEDLTWYQLGSHRQADPQEESATRVCKHSHVSARRIPQPPPCHKWQKAPRPWGEDHVWRAHT